MLVGVLPSLLAAGVEGTTLVGADPAGVAFTGPPAPMETMVKTMMAKNAMAKARAISVIALPESPPVVITFPLGLPPPFGKKDEPPQWGQARQSTGRDSWAYGSIRLGFLKRCGGADNKISWFALERLSGINFAGGIRHLFYVILCKLLRKVSACFNDQIMGKLIRKIGG